MTDLAVRPDSTPSAGSARGRARPAEAVLPAGAVAAADAAGVAAPAGVAGAVLGSGVGLTDGGRPARSAMPGLVATDLDGTIVRSDDTVSGRTFAAFARIKAAGIPIVAVTGRGPRLLELIRRDMPVADFVVMAQGAAVMDLTVGPKPETLFTAAMPGPLVAEVIARVEEQVGPLSLLVEPVDGTDTNLLGEWHSAWRYRDAVSQCSRAEALCAPVIKAFVHSDRFSADELLALARTLIGPEVVEMTQAGLGYVEICPAGATKATGLALVAAHLGLDAADALVFGDMPNDLPMFAWAGWGRVAVANAHPELLAVADEVTLSNDDHGVAVYLERLLSDA